jgi:hypothetical protein
MSSRSGQLYMQLTKHREIIEKEQAKSAMGVADLTLSEAAALCVLAGRLERLMDFAKRAEGINGEDLIKLCIEQGFSVIKDEVARKKKNATGYCSECSSAICSFSTSNGCCSAVPTSKAASLQHFRILTGGLASWAASGASLIAGKTASRNSSKLGKPSALRTRTRPFQEVEVELLAAQKAAGIMGQPFG